MNLENIAKLLGVLSIIVPVIVPFLPKAQKWLFGIDGANPQILPSPAAQITLAVLGGLFSGAILVTAFAFLLPAVKQTDIAEGIAVNATVLPGHGGAVYNASASCKKDEIAIGVRCQVIAGTAGTLVNSGAVDGGASCTWNNTSTTFAAFARPICLRVRAD